ncbi:MAG: bis(5'-nucleosyl)-tetraphosphatase (symmetrical) YqeK [Firmicutes bacterium]|nr:bis(5'-nucleosyl)-tetraphosphatase (symmetrical) YqeK [Bacillota bacterium]
MNSSEQIDAYRQKLARDLSPRRFQHSLSVAQTAAALAERWQVPKEKAYLAGLIHDVGRCYTPAQLRQKAAELHLELDEWQNRHDPLLHAPVGAAILEQEWGVTDAEILEAVKYHTVGHPQMSLLAKIIFLADIIEPLRQSWPGLEQLRDQAYIDLDRAILAALAYTFSYLAGKQEPCHPMALQTYQTLKEKYNGGNDMEQTLSSETMLQLAVRAAQEKKAADLLSLELKGITTIADYFLIMSVNNNRLAQATADHICEKLKEAGAALLRMEGYRDSRWILLDFGSLVVHIFLQDERQYYNLEKLWADAPAQQYE